MELKEVLDKLSEMYDELEEADKQKKTRCPFIDELGQLVEDLYQIEQGKGHRLVDSWQTMIDEYIQD